MCFIPSLIITSTNLAHRLTAFTKSIFPKDTGCSADTPIRQDHLELVAGKLFDVDIREIQS